MCRLRPTSTCQGGEGTRHRSCQIIMSSSCETLQFRFPTHGDSILSKIDALRREHRFCDVTLLLGGALHFHGHRVVLAASSDFLRDQFLLHQGRAELSVGVVSSVEVGKRLLLSCYTGLLEVPLRELVSFLTAASALQMSQVVEKCAQAISQYLGPTLAFLKVDRRLSEEEEVQQPHGLDNQEKRDTARPIARIQEVSTEERGAVVVRSKTRVSQGPKTDGQGLEQVGDERRVDVGETELADDACCIESKEVPPVHTEKPSDADHCIKGTQRCKPSPPAAAQGLMLPSTTRGSSSKQEESVDTSQNHDKEAEGEERSEKEMFLMAVQLQECGELSESDLCDLSGERLVGSHCSADELTEDPDGILVQRPYLCRRCDRVFQHLESYVGHLKQHRQHLCLVCGKGFPQKSNLTRHVHAHTGVKPFRCPLCHKTFSQRSTLQDHLNLHTGDRPHRCNYCAMHFAQKPGLRRHLKDIHGKTSLQNVLEEPVDEGHSLS